MRDVFETGAQINLIAHIGEDTNWILLAITNWTQMVPKARCSSKIWAHPFGCRIDTGTTPSANPNRATRGLIPVYQSWLIVSKAVSHREGRYPEIL